MPSLTHALKEWQVAVTALERGEMIVLLRKGGIREGSGKFTIAHDRVLLYPTYEHQKPQLLQPPYTSHVEPVASGWHPETVHIAAWANITETLQVSEHDRVMALLPFHVWNAEFVSERLKWKPTQPVQVLLLRTYRLPQPQIIPYRNAYGGCKSWIDLETAIDLNHSVPVLDDATYEARVQQIRAIVLNA